MEMRHRPPTPSPALSDCFCHFKFDGSPQGFGDQGRRRRITDRPADDLAAEQVEHGGQIYTQNLAKLARPGSRA